MTARNRVVREPYATWCGRTPVEIIHGLLPDCGSDGDGEKPRRFPQPPGMTAATVKVPST